jgi:hypothetical protein
MQFITITDTSELEDCATNLPVFDKDSNDRYQKLLDFMLQINKDAGAFQTIVTECLSDEMAVANKGKYMDSVYNIGC